MTYTLRSTLAPIFIVSSQSYHLCNYRLPETLGTRNEPCPRAISAAGRRVRSAVDVLPVPRAESGTLQPAVPTAADACLPKRRGQPESEGIGVTNVLYKQCFIPPLSVPQMCKPTAVRPPDV